MELINAYKRWADGGVDVSITGNVMVDRRYLGELGNVVVEMKYVSSSKLVLFYTDFLKLYNVPLQRVRSIIKHHMI